MNFLSEYKNIIFLGQLRKTPAYYKAKSLILSSEKQKYSTIDIKYNEMLIDTIQQIGRTCYRKNDTTNVYLFDNEEVVNYLINNLAEYFDTIEQEYENEYLYSERKEYSTEGVRYENTYESKFLELIYQFLQQEKQQYGYIDKQYVFRVSEIKKAINFTSRNVGRDLVKPIKKLVKDNFIIHEPRKKRITLNLEEL